MTLVVNLVKTVISVKFICWWWQNPYCNCHVTQSTKV